MKKTIALIVALMLSVLALAGCGGGESGADPADAAVTVDSLKTIGDVIALESDTEQSSVSGDKVVYVFKVGDTYYRAIATISEEDADAYFAIDFEDEDYEQQQEAIVAGLPIDEIQNLSEMIPEQSELDEWVGKTGGELMDAGWYCSGYNLDDEVFWMTYGPFMYDVTFDADFSDVDNMDWEAEEGLKDLKVTSVTYKDIGDAANLEEEDVCE